MDMKKYYFLKKTCIVILFIFLLTNAVFSANENYPQISHFRYSITPEKIRFVFDFNNEPQVKAYFIRKELVLYVELYGYEINPEIKKWKGFKDKLLHGYSILNINPFKKVCKIRLNYPVPSENIKIFTLGDPQRLVVDLIRKYNFETEIPVTSNIVWKKIKKSDNEGFNLLNFVKINKDSKEVSLDVCLANDSTSSREKTSEMAKRTNATVAINGGFFSFTGGSLGLIVKDGKMKSKPVTTRPPRSCFLLTNDDKVLFDRVKIVEDKLFGIEAQSLIENIKIALGAGPRLIRSGISHITALEEELGPGGNDITRNAGRSIVGTLKDGNLFFVSVSGYKNNHSQGIKFKKITDWLIREKAQDALNLDGGGSTTLVINNKIVSTEEGAEIPERKVGNCMLVKDASPIILPSSISIETDKWEVVCDGKTEVKIKAVVKNLTGENMKDNTPVEFTTNMGEIIPAISYTKNGAAEATLKTTGIPGSHCFTVKCGLIEQQQWLRFNPSKPERIFWYLEKPEGEKKNYTFSVFITDNYFNPISSIEGNLKSEALQVVSGMKFITGNDGISKMNFETSEKGSFNIQVLVPGMSPENIFLEL